LLPALECFFIAVARTLTTGIVAVQDSDGHGCSNSATCIRASCGARQGGGQAHPAASWRTLSLVTAHWLCVHPISARESRALRKLLREAPTSPYVFISERRAPLSAAGYQRMVARAGVAAKFTFLIHSHMLRHACGFKLANDGHTLAPSRPISVTARSCRQSVTRR
jgi:hypothetical protein